jgi:hypothetical protein
MTQRSYEDDLVSDFDRRVWPVIDVEARLMRAARAAERPAQSRRRSA